MKKMKNPKMVAMGKPKMTLSEYRKASKKMFKLTPKPSVPARKARFTA